MPGPRHDEPSYALGELTDRAGVTVRTVRYYITEGLLPPPVGAGPNARYTGEHLDRLLLIARLKDAYMPLKEIRRHLQGMTAAEIHAAARSAPSQAAEAPPDSAADYIHRVLREEAPPYVEFAAQTPPRERAQASRQPSREATWRRIAVTDEAELLITDDAYDRRREQVEAALAWLRRILNDR